MAGRDIVTIGAPSGGVEALMKVVGGLPEDLPAAVFVVPHFPESAPSVLSRILDRVGPLEEAVIRRVLTEGTQKAPAGRGGLP